MKKSLHHLYQDWQVAQSTWPTTGNVQEWIDAKDAFLSAAMASEDPTYRPIAERALTERDAFAEDMDRRYDLWTAGLLPIDDEARRIFNDMFPDDDPDDDEQL